MENKKARYAGGAQWAFSVFRLAGDLGAFRTAIFQSVPNKGKINFNARNWRWLGRVGAVEIGFLGRWVLTAEPLSATPAGFRSDFVWG
ncbi:MAG: hypothetical protein NTV52_33400 [Acidobacteria bacterium]|nr:hypothetical protein [Acidobacteriota bacterium]